MPLRQVVTGQGDAHCSSSRALTDSAEKFMKILVTGSSGFIGARLCQAWSNRGAEVVGTYGSSPSLVPSGVARVALDVKDPVAVTTAVGQCRPDVVIHCAAFASLQGCEDDHQEAEACNRDGSRHVASAAKQVGAAMIYLSTDLVFAGSRGWYVDAETPQPACRYGATKYEGEKAVLAECPEACILRLSWVYGTSANEHRCSAECMIDTLGRGRRVTLFTDEFRTPVLVDDVVGIVEAVALARVAGTFHVSGPRRISRYEFGLLCTKAFALSEESIVPASGSTTASLRPKDCSLVFSSRLRQLPCECRDPAEGLSYMASSRRRAKQD